MGENNIMEKESCWTINVGTGDHDEHKETVPKKDMTLSEIMNIKEDRPFQTAHNEIYKICGTKLYRLDRSKDKQEWNLYDDYKELVDLYNDGWKYAKQLSDKELALCKDFNAKWVSRDYTIVGTYVTLWKDKPVLCSGRTLMLHDYYVSANSNESYIVRLPIKFFPSVSEGDCIEVK